MGFITMFMHMKKLQSIIIKINGNDPCIFQSIELFKSFTIYSTNWRDIPLLFTRNMEILNYLLTRFACRTGIQRTFRSKNNPVNSIS